MKAKNARKPEVGHLKKAGIETPMRHLEEFRVRAPWLRLLGYIHCFNLFEKQQAV